VCIAQRATIQLHKELNVKKQQKEIDKDTKAAEVQPKRVEVRTQVRAGGGEDIFQ
jgi:hypothetical protein